MLSTIDSISVPTTTLAGLLLINDRPAPVPEVVVRVSEVVQGAVLPCATAPHVTHMLVQSLKQG